MGWVGRGFGSGGPVELCWGVGFGSVGCAGLGWTGDLVLVGTLGWNGQDYYKYILISLIYIYYFAGISNFIIFLKLLKL